MAPNEDKPTHPRACPDTPGDEIVISGISGRFPSSRDVSELEYNLYNKVDMIDDSEKRWRHENAEIPRRTGKIHELEKFDATFFGIHFKQAHTMDPQARILVEHAYEAILDAGINPKAMRGTRTAVYIGACFNESEKTWFYEKISNGGFGITGCSRAMLANRISYVLGLHGQSFLLDTACSSSMTAVDCAFSAIRSGECDAAIVGASNLLLHPYLTLQFARIGVLAPNGLCRPFDENACGYTRSEAITCILIQKAKDAKRIYGTIMYSKTNCDGYKEEGITYPSGVMQAKLLDQFYKEINIKPETVDFVEAHSTGTVVGDPEECGALDQIFCKNRKIPLPVGSVKSNLGHTEGAAGICSIAKCILALENQIIPPNINFTKVRPGVKSLEENRLQVVAESQKLEGPLIAINSFGFGGANAHCLLRANPKQKINKGAPMDNLPRLVNWSGRTELACNVLLDSLTTMPLDAEYIALLQNTQSDSSSPNVFKSYGLFSHAEGENAQCIVREVQHYSGIKRPLVYVFSGMGSQWVEMGTSLMEIPMFRKSIQNCHDVLLPKGLDLINIITSPDKSVFDNILNSFVGIASIQIAICDLLNALGIKPDYIIGHSVGELGCAYADNCLTAEQMILCAYSRGLASLETEKIKGSMAAIGMGYRNIRNMLPSTIDTACHNSADSCTISGPQDEVEKFVASLTAQDVFAKEVPCSNIAYHSRYISDMGPKLLGYLSEIITEPKKRSEKWLSSSIPKNKWELPESQYCSAQYQTNNLLSSVLFEETVSLLPQNATTIEIAPHGLLQAIIRKSMSTSIHIPLAQRGNKDNLNYFLQALGKIYLTGIDMAIENIYPKIEFPVSRGTPKISHLVRWDHSEDWYVLKFEAERNKTGERKLRVSLADQDFEYITGHIIDGRCLFPATAYLHLVWETFALTKGILFTNLSVHFEDIRFMRATTVSRESEVELVVMIQAGTGRFEITEGTTAVVTGYIREAEGDDILVKLPEIEKSDYPYLPTKDFYKELRLRGYHYSGLFKNVIEARTDGLVGKIKWEDNWVAFMDCLLQVCIVGKDTRNLMIPTRIEKITIDTKRHIQLAQDTFDKDDLKTFIYDVTSNKSLAITEGGGIQIKGLHASPINRRKPPGIPVLESYKFLPYIPTPKLSKTDAAKLCVQHALENCPIAKIRTIEILDELIEPIINKFKNAVEDLPLTTADSMILTSQEIECDNIHVEDGKLSSQSNCMFVIKSNCLSELTFVEGALTSLHDDGYLVSRECQNLNVESIVPPQGLRLIAVLPMEEETLVLLQKIKRRIPKVPTVVKISSFDKSFEWLEPLRTAIKAGAVIAYSENESHSGIIGLINCIRKEPESMSVVCLFINDPTAPPFDIEDSFYKNQLALEMAINVYQDGQWGTYRHLSLEKTVMFGPTNLHAYANMTQRGDLSSMRWMRGPITDNKELLSLKIQYSSLNFRDVMLATGKLSAEVIGTTRIQNDCILGFEYSGVDENGKRAMGMIMWGALSTHIISGDGFKWLCPDSWTLEQAATIPVVYSTVYSALFIQGRARAGSSILIHAGTGGVGLAGIRVALAYNMNIYTTVSTNEKKQFLLNTFPELRECQIGNSRDTSFEQMIKLQTNGKGVDFVLNSLAEEKLQASLRCLGKGGRFLEIGKFDMANDTKIGLGGFLKEMSFHAILVDNLFTSTKEERNEITDLIQRDIDNGIIQPLPATVYPAHEIEQALRYLASAKHIGKVLLKIRENPYDEMSLPISLIPRINCDPNACYVIPGGLGGFGLELTDWLVIRGARKFVLSSSRGITKPYQSYRIRIWQNYGVNVVVNTANIATPEGCMALIKEAKQLGPVAGIFNLAVILRDNIYENQTTETFTESFGPKAVATKYLDEITRVHCPELKHFVIFSSVSCGRGNAGQTNYGMANSIMERIIEQRHRENLPAKAIQWGAVGEVGLVADMIEDKLDMEIGGTLQQRISSCLEELDGLLFGDCPIVSSMVVAEKRVIGGGGDIIATVMNIMSIRDIKSVSMDATLSELGMDSLMAVEIKQTLEREFELFLTPQDLRSLTFAKLYELADARQKSAGEKTKLKLTGEGLTGIHMLIRSLGDEESSLIPVLRLKSNNNSEKFDSAIIVIPGVEGVVGSAWNNIATALNQPTFCVQLRTSIGLPTVKDMAQKLYEHVYSEVIKYTDSFYIVGYSFGSFIALELAYILEKNGLTGQVVLIDGAPEFLKKLAFGHLQTDITDEAIQITLACGIIRVIFPEEDPEELYKKISDIPTWELRKEKVLDLAKSQTVYSQKYLDDMGEGLYQRIKLAMDCKEDEIPKIQAAITLIRPTEVSVVDIDEDYNLNKLTDGPVSLKFIEGNHATMLENPKLPSILNEINPMSKSDSVFQKFIQSRLQTIS